MQDDPLSALLPKPPVPRPDRREAAIGEAIRRFDGDEATPTAGGRSPRAGRSWLATPWGRPQIGAVLATALVGLIALPLWVSRDRHPELTNPGATTFAVAPTAPARTPIAEQAAPPPPIVAAPPATNSAALPGMQAEQRAVTSQADKAEAAPKAVGALAASSAKSEEAVVSVSRRTANLAPPAIVLAEPVPVPAPPPPPAAPAMARAATSSARERDEGSDDVIVTARRVEGWKASPAPRRPRARRTSQAGDWNACTVNDPTRSLVGCTEPASGHVAEGLARAWRGDLDGAVAAFDQAIAASQQPGLAYLNRGLVYDRKGDRERAVADLDRAIRHAPNSARAYYNRSLVFQRKGEKDRAGADADRAIELDPRYNAVIR